MIYEFDGFKPVIDPTSYIHPQAAVIGNVIIGKNVYVGPFCTLRGDWGKIEIHDGANIQESCTIHMFPGKDAVLMESAHIGHGAIIHGGIIGENSLIGMNAVIMDDVEIGKECIVGALSFVKARTKVPNRSLLAGNPAKIIKEVSDEMIGWKTKGTELYQKLPKDCYRSLKECKPLTEIEKNRPQQKSFFKPW